MKYLALLFLASCVGPRHVYLESGMYENYESCNSGAVHAYINCLCSQETARAGCLNTLLSNLNVCESLKAE